MKRKPRIARRVFVAFVVLAASVDGPAQSPTSFKIAFYNIRSGKGSQPLKGHDAPFAEADNCTDRSKPINAWGAGVVQRELSHLASDNGVIALGLAEAWNCAKPSAVRQVLGWNTATEERNGTALVARYGIKGSPHWLQLDTSKNTNPKDTAWVLGAAVCVEKDCRTTVDVYVAHWAGSGPSAPETYDSQARDTIAMMSSSRGPHVLVGDLNVFEGSSRVCSQNPNSTTLPFLRSAGYVDAWPRLHPGDDGFTGMTNRAGCGHPQGATWKRIDYAWSKGILPTAIDRFGVVPPGDAAPSDHYGITAEYAR
jgi:exonuclease III